MQRVFIATIAAIVFSLAFALENKQILKGGKVNGNFEFLGTLCFPPTEGSDVSIETTAESDGIKLIFYDGQEDSWPLLATPLPGPDRKARSCTDKLRQAKNLSSSGSPVWDIDVPKGHHTEHFHIHEKFERQWYFVAVNCSDMDSEGEPEEIRMSHYKITSPDAIPCKGLHEWSQTGYSVTVIFLSVMVVALLVVAGIFYGASRQPTLDEGNLTGYNEL
jgi:hypothetical protein